MSAEQAPLVAVDMGGAEVMAYGDEINFLANVRFAAGQERVRRQSPAKTEQVADKGTATATKKGAEIKAELDDLLDEIDEVLEENAEEFVRSYVQKGGQ